MLLCQPAKVPQGTSIMRNASIVSLAPVVFTSVRVHRRRRARMLAILSLLLVLPGCPPTETPGYSPDGKTIALVAFDPKAKRSALWLYDVQTRTARPHLAPKGWTMSGVQW